MVLSVERPVPWAETSLPSTDGEREMTLGGDSDLAVEMLRVSVEEPKADHRHGLVLDLRATGELDAEQQGTLLRIAAAARRRDGAAGGSAAEYVQHDDLASRHRRAVARSLQRAERAATAGDFDEALEWLEFTAAVNGHLPAGWSERRQRWIERDHDVAG